MKNSNGTQEGVDFCLGCMEFKKGSGFMNSRSSTDQSKIQTAEKESSERFARQTLFRRSSVCELSQSTVIVIEACDEYNHRIQNPLLFITQTPNP
jgi:hypothetical protein